MLPVKRQKLDGNMPIEQVKTLSHFNITPETNPVDKTYNPRSLSQMNEEVDTLRF